MTSKNLFLTASFLTILVLCPLNSAFSAEAKKPDFTLTLTPLTNEICSEIDKFQPINLSTIQTQLTVGQTLTITKKVGENSTCPATAANTANKKEVKLLGNFIIDIPINFMLDESACQPSGTKNSYPFICIYDDEKWLGIINYTYDTRPISVTLASTTAEYAQVSLTITSSSAQIQNFQICYAPSSTINFDSNLDCESSESDLEKTEWPKMMLVNSTSVTIDKLTNDEEYVFKGRAISVDDKKQFTAAISNWSKPINATPEDSQYFSDLYNEGAPIELDGCNQIKNTPSLFPLFGLLALLLISFRRRKTIVLPGKFLLVAILLVSSNSHAHLGQINLGFTGSPYLPNFNGS
ncbi:MAG: hypothetical protein O2897_01305, partial [bacterium]|nr:hypothetical protein [bacterium]